MSIALDKANFLALVLETVLFGVFTVLFGAALWLISTKRGGVNALLLGTLCTIWVLSTTHWIIDVYRAVAAFVALENGNALAYYSNLANPLQAAKTAVYVTLTLVADSFVIYRCYIIWNQTIWVIIFPIMCLLATGVGGYGATWAFSQATPGSVIFLPDIVPWVTSFISMTFCTNVICTGLIAVRILSIQRRIRALATETRTHSALVIMAESAALYSTSVLSLLVTYLVGSNAQYTVLDLTSPLIGITFSVIILRVSLGLTQQGSPSTRTTSSLRIGGSENHTLGQLNRSRTVAVNVATLVTVDDGFGEGDSQSKDGYISDGENHLERMGKGM